MGGSGGPTVGRDCRASRQWSGKKARRKRREIFRGAWYSQAMSEHTTSAELVCQYHCECGEGPMWHAQEQALYWVDIPTGRLFRYDPADDRHERVHQGRPIGGFTVQADGSLLLFRDRGTVELFRNGSVQRTVVKEIPDEVHTRFNDVAADPQGRVFCGTMPSHNRETGEKRLGRLYRMDRDASLRIVEEGVGCSNGIGFTPDLTKMYFIDTPTKTVWLYDYDRATGGLTNRRAFVNVEGDTGGGGAGGGPDGMTVDAEGDLWVAVWGGACVLNYGADGKLKGKIELPTKNVTSVTFGGADLDELYITSAIGGNKEADPKTAGALFRARPGVRGREEFVSRVG